MAASECVFGLHAVDAMLRRAPARVQELRVQEGRVDGRMQALLDLAAQARVSVCRVARRELDAVVGDARHQGVIAMVEPVAALGERDLPDLLLGLEGSGTAPLLLVLDGVTDPHNLGACLRTADGAGVTAVIAPRDRAAGLTPVVRKVASGAAESVPFIQVTNLARTLDLLKEEFHLWIVGTSGEATGDLYGADLAGPTALVLGAEGKGMRRLTMERCDALVKLPMLGRVESLNVSVAAGVCLYEAVRQRRIASTAPNG
ncbi:23S rRNA (guanosine(2251)-2'-O)-methyltransferase RlmB [Ectothiorhodospira lacustris]|uniref:23S rRNA (guanosine(2251)-2'-O)-methyltransferase RlmB n=1 Tax=Ectothiorhodospira lacustris TaxID=2899127 RepID=UPI001EE7C1A2|nr:23S rRNA (guanosine(2251)-2'-O)-methyltransferase RlmB [Ectothiorhodospira lacustris]MCG5500157.1 23S rRNA (guanosine(2251)-2'-O)-methyltransferase RlmB [Ectothiorhodospira lacustris]MCG5510921.1 23S rRNA (guanosine(2251)-2'-O)-methyltransferase RlmB [Ectothiorhodospira lacustris]MCG5522653.1 23S rRNA (guanosine(2251)-2'-O)-methyltransferase RlmB [Ectothiorhodospira lacustris]